MATSTIEQDVESAVAERYSPGANGRQAELCCPVQYDPRLLEAIPAEVIERDYGCGDPTRYLAPGEAVLDLGSGSGKACFLAAQVVGARGRVVGVDMNDDMLDLARRHAPAVAQRIGYDVVEFKKAKIQDLALDLDELDRFLAEHPARSHRDLGEVERRAAALRERAPAVASDSIDVVVSSCVLNLVRPDDKKQLFDEIFRVLKPGGRAIISDIVSDEDVPRRLQADPELWSGCISGSFREDELLRAFEDAGFHGLSILERQTEPWRTVEGIEFRSLTLAAYRGKQGPCIDKKHAAIYRGPFSEARDDDGHVYRRGVRTAVCEKTFRLLAREPYRDHFERIEPRVAVSDADARPFPDCSAPLVRHPRETKGDDDELTTDASACCEPDCC